jgi:PEP-CTERM motif
METVKMSLCSPVAVIVLFGVLSSSAQTGTDLFTGSETTVSLNPGLYDITAYGAQGGSANSGLGIGGLGAEMSAEFSFSGLTTLTLMVGGAGEIAFGGGGGGGSFVVNGSTPLIIAGGGGGGGVGYNGSVDGGLGLVGTGGGAGYGGSAGGSGGSGGVGHYSGAGGGLLSDGGAGLFYNGILYSGGGGSFLDGGTGGFSSFSGGYGGYGGGGGGTAGGGGGGGYSGGGGAGDGDGGGGGGSYIDASALAILSEFSGIASPDDSPNGEIIITEVPEPSSFALLALSGLLGLPFLGWKRRSQGMNRLFRI